MTTCSFDRWCCMVLLLNRLRLQEIIVAKRSEKSGGTPLETFAKTEPALRKVRGEESCERDQSGKQETELHGKQKWQKAHAETLARIVPVRTPSDGARRLPLRLPGAGRPERVLRVHEVYRPELAGGKEITNFRTVKGGSSRQTGVRRSFGFFNTDPDCEFLRARRTLMILAYAASAGIGFSPPDCNRPGVLEES